MNIVVEQRVHDVQKLLHAQQWVQGYEFLGALINDVNVVTTQWTTILLPALHESRETAKTNSLRAIKQNGIAKLTAADIKHLFNVFNINIEPNNALLTGEVLSKWRSADNVLVKLKLPKEKYIEAIRLHCVLQFVASSDAVLEMVSVVPWVRQHATVDVVQRFASHRITTVMMQYLDSRAAELMSIDAEVLQELVDKYLEDPTVKPVPDEDVVPDSSLSCIIPSLCSTSAMTTLRSSVMHF